MGKYTKLLEGKPKLGAEPSVAEKVEEYKQKLCAVEGLMTSSGSLAELYIEARDEVAELNEQLSHVNIRVEALRQLLVDSAENDGISSLRLANGRGVVIVTEPYPQVIDKEAFRLWCIEQGYEHNMVLHAMTAKSIVSERLIAGEPTPPGVDIFAKAIIKVMSK